MLDLGIRQLERELFLAAFGVVLEEFDPWILDRLTSILDEAHVRAGQILWSEGQPVESLYFMREGRVRLTRGDAPPWTFEGEWVLGTVDALFDEGARRTAVALTDLHAFTISRNDWLDLLEDSFELLIRSIERTANTVAKLEERVPMNTEPSWPVAVSPVPLEGTLDAIERLAFLTELGIARGAGVQVLADLAATSVDRVLHPEEVLFRSGDTHTHVYLVMSGEVVARREEPSIVRRYFSGEPVAGAAALTESARDWEAHAHTRARVLAIPLEAFYDLIEEHFDLGRSVLIAFAVRRERILEQLAEQAGPEGLVLR